MARLLRLKLLFGVGFGISAFVYPEKGVALGPGGAGANVGSEQFNLSDVGPLSGPWSISGGVDGFGSVLNNPTPTIDGRNEYVSYSIGEAVITVQKTAGWLQFYYSGGAWQALTMGLTSDYGTFNTLARLGSTTNPLPTPTFKWYFLIRPSKYWGIQAGENPSLEGIEVGYDFINPTFFVSQLNNTELTPAYGPQLNLYYGPATFNLQFSDGYKKDRFNTLSALLTYNLNPSGSDYVIGFGHTVLGHTLNPVYGAGFSELNSSLIGAGAQLVFGPWTVMPEAQYQWLPKSSVSDPAVNPAPRTTYYAAAAMVDVTYEFTRRWSLTVQPQIFYQNSDKNDPNQNLFGNWLQFDVAPGPGTFSPGTTMFGLQITPTWQEKNFFIRPTIAWTHVSGFTPGTGYGHNGTDPNQVVGVMEVGFLIGKYGA